MSQEENSGDRDIICGDMEKEVDRLQTFAAFPSDSISETDLAQSLFFYTGFEDRVKCYSCGKEVQDWVTGEDPCNPGWHHCYCKKMLLSLEEGNPLELCPLNTFSIWSPEMKSRMNSLTLKLYSSNPTRKPLYSQPAKFQDCDMFESHPEILFKSHVNLLNDTDLDCKDGRRRTFTSCENFPEFLANQLSENGFFYLGNLDRTQCYYCGGVLRNWGPNDNIPAIHKACFPSCRFSSQRETTVAVFDNQLQEFETGDVNMMMIERYQVKPFAQFFPFRRQYFSNATQKLDISSGFEDQDKSDCWICKGGLNHWVPHDSPWIENQYICFGCRIQTRDGWIAYVREIKNNFPVISVRHLETYDIHSMVLAMKIGLKNMRIVHNKQSLLSKFHDEFTKIPPNAQRPDVWTEENPRGQKRRSFQGGSPTSKRKTFPNSTAVSLKGLDMHGILPGINQQFRNSDINPLFPHLSDSTSRLRTFNRSELSREFSKALANAGFYFTGQCVKCWCCGGELFDLSDNTDPMEEHARHFPMCRNGAIGT